MLRVSRPGGVEGPTATLDASTLQVSPGRRATDVTLQASLRSSRGGEHAIEGGKWSKSALNWPNVVIGGGTPNIQRNIIAERILGLPKDGSD